MADMSDDKITQFRDEYFFLSNFYLCNIEYNGFKYTSVEAAFQAQKCLDKNVMAEFTKMTPGQAKKHGRKVKLRNDWESVKLSIMEELVRIKFTSNRDIQQLLLDTQNAELIEGNNWNDRFWGVCKGKGENNLGKILMKIRNEFLHN